MWDLGGRMGLRTAWTLGGRVGLWDDDGSGRGECVTRDGDLPSPGVERQRYESLIHNQLPWSRGDREHWVGSRRGG